MERVKRTYALPNGLLARFEGEVPPGRRSAKIAELIEAWVEEREREALRKAVIEGCRDMAEVDGETLKEWEAADDELWQSIER
jgi:hypothetical protein